MKLTKRAFTLTAALSLSALAAGAPAFAETVEEFYKGKTLRVISPSGPEATFTTFARLMAPYVEKYSGASVKIEPMPGAGGYEARNAMFEQDPDGLTIVLVGHGAKLITGSMFELDGVRYDWTKFVPLGKVVDSTVMVFVKKDSPWETPEELREETFNYGESSPFFGPQVAEALGWKNMSVIPGYRSTADRAAAIARGEILATAASKEVVVSYPDDVRLLVVAHKQADFPDVPTIEEFADGEHGKKYAELIAAWTGLLNMSYAPPGLSEEKAAFLESVLAQVWADPEFAADLEKVKAIPTAGAFLDRAGLQEYMDGLAALTPEEVEELKFVITEKYKKK